MTAPSFFFRQLASTPRDTRPCGMELDFLAFGRRMKETNSTPYSEASVHLKAKAAGEEPCMRIDAVEAVGIDATR